MAGHGGQRGANKETRQNVLPFTKALAKMTNCTRRAKDHNNFPYKSGTLVAVG